MQCGFIETRKTKKKWFYQFYGCGFVIRHCVEMYVIIIITPYMTYPSAESSSMRHSLVKLCPRPGSPGVKTLKLFSVYER